MAPKVYSLRSPGDVDDGKNNNFASNALVEESKCILQVYPDILPTTFSVKLSTRPAETHPKVPAYPMKGRNRGVAFIVNVITFLKKVHPTRNGADIDGRNLISVFQQLGFVVFYYEDITMGVSTIFVLIYSGPMYTYIHKQMTCLYF